MDLEEIARLRHDTNMRRRSWNDDDGADLDEDDSETMVDVRERDVEPGT